MEEFILAGSVVWAGGLPGSAGFIMLLAAITESPHVEEVLFYCRLQLHTLALCPDRCWAQAQNYISKSLGQQFVESSVLDISLMVEESRKDTPMICFLSMGSDPTTMIEQTAKKDRVKVEAISMGQGQEILARKLLAEKMEIVPLPIFINK